MVGPLYLLSESSQHGTHGTKPHQQPPSAWQVSFGLKNSNPPLPGEVLECFVSSGIIGQVSDSSGQVPPSQLRRG
jgi:hypothetical protein